MEYKLFIWLEVICIKIIELISELQKFEKQYGSDLPVKTFDLDRDVVPVSEVELSTTVDGQKYVYLGA